MTDQMNEPISEQDRALLRHLLSLKFQQNMAFMEEKFPHLAEQFRDYKPEAMGLEIDDDGNVNIAGPEGFIYPKNPIDICDEQAKKYFEKPLLAVYRLGQQGWEASMKLFKHAQILKHLVDIGEEYVQKAKGCNEQPYDWFPLFTVLGVGIGFHIERIVEQADKIGHLVIYEPNKDLFFASLHVVDYITLYETFTTRNKGITLLVGDTKEQFIQGLQKVMFQIGIWKSCALPIYRHYDSATTEEGLKRFFDNLSNFYAGFGFIEDEIISTRHTLRNLKDRHHIIASQTDGREFNKPVFICANGPSIDYSIDFLKENRDKGIIISCGTGLKTLCQHGIKPHIHIEIERTDGLADYIKGVDESGEFTSQIPLLGMNTLSPKVVSLFKSVNLFFKPNDVGTEMARVTTHPHFGEYLHLFNSNPTVSNAAMALAIHFKAPQIYLFGVDVGYTDPNYHHSKSSVYYGKFKGAVETNNVALKQLPGNFRETVYTNAVLDWCRHVLELVIHIKGQEIEIFNTSDGALIKGAQPIHIEDIVLPESSVEPFDADDWLRRIEKVDAVDFETMYACFKLRAKSINEMLDFLRDKRYTEIDWTSNDAFELFQRNHLKLRAMVGGVENPSARMLEGSMVYLQITIMGYMHLIHDKAIRDEFVGKAMEIFVKYFNAMKREFRAFEREMKALEAH